MYCHTDRFVCIQLKITTAHHGVKEGKRNGE